MTVASLPCAPVEGQQLAQIDRRYAVTPGQHERARAEIGLQAFDAPAGLGLLAGVDQVDLPVVAM